MTDDVMVADERLARTARTIRLAVSGALTVLCALSAVVTLADIHTPLRSGITVVSLIVGTGWAATCWIDLKDAAFAATVTLATGFSIVCFTALLFLEIHWWHPVASIGTLLIVAAVVNGAATAREALRRVAP